jgi:hypothetical protein
VAENWSAVTVTGPAIPHTSISIRKPKKEQRQRFIQGGPSGEDRPGQADVNRSERVTTVAVVVNLTRSPNKREGENTKSMEITWCATGRLIPKWRSFQAPSQSHCAV